MNPLREPLTLSTSGIRNQGLSRLWDDACRPSNGAFKNLPTVRNILSSRPDRPALRTLLQSDRVERKRGTPDASPLPRGTWDEISSEAILAADLGESAPVLALGVRQQAPQQRKETPARRQARDPPREALDVRRQGCDAIRRGTLRRTRTLNGYEQVRKRAAEPALDHGLERVKRQIPHAAFNLAHIFRREPAPLRHLLLRELLSLPQSAESDSDGTDQIIASHGRGILGGLTETKNP